MELALHGPLVILEAMLNGGCPGSAKFDFRIPVSNFTVEGCVGICEFAVSTLWFLSEGDDDYKGDPVDCGPFLDFIAEELRRKQAHWRDVCAAARPGKSWCGPSETEEKWPRQGVTVATGNGFVVRMTLCVTTLWVSLFKGTKEEQKAKDAAREAKRAAEQAAEQLSKRTKCT
jgi:hypothetical protein